MKKEEQWKQEPSLTQYKMTAFKNGSGISMRHNFHWVELEGYKFQCDFNFF